MKQRSPTAAALLSFFIPFYVLYWLYVVANDMKRRSVNVPNFLLLIGPVLGLLIMAFLPVLLRAGQTGDGTQAAGNIIIILLGILVVPLVIILPFIYYYKFCKAAETVTGGQVSAGLTFILMVVLTPIAVYLIQEKLNLVAQGAPATADPFAAPPVSPLATTSVSQPPTPPAESGQNPSGTTPV